MATVFGSFVLALLALQGNRRPPPRGERVVETSLYTWMAVGGLNIDVGFLLDPLSAVMIAFVTGVGFLIHVYSRGYMADDPGAVAVLMLPEPLHGLHAHPRVGAKPPHHVSRVGGGGPLLLPPHRVLVREASAGDAGKKAFIVNRIGDFGVLLGTFLLFTHLER